MEAESAGYFAVAVLAIFCALAMRIGEWIAKAEGEEKHERR